MMKTYFRILLLILSVGFTLNSYGQQAALQQRKQQKAFYSRVLQVDSVKAGQVTQIQDTYKAGLRMVIADTSLNEGLKRSKIQALMNVKNKQLELLLSPIQQAKIIPTTEREQPKSITSAKAD